MELRRGVVLLASCIPVSGVSNDESARSLSYEGRPGLITVSEDTPMFGTMRVVRWYDLAIFSVDGVYASGMGETHVCLDDPSVAAGKISRRALRGDYGRLMSRSRFFFVIDVDCSLRP